MHLACFSVIIFIGYAHSVKCGRLIHERSIGASRQKIAYCHQGMREIDVSFNKVRVSAMVFNTTFKNISVIYWRSVYWSGKPAYPEKTIDLSQVTENFCFHIMLYRIHLAEWESNSQC